MNLTLSKKQLFLAAIIWWLVFVVLSYTNNNAFELLNIIGFPALIFLPGILTLFITRINVDEFWGRIGLTVGVSLLELMITGLFINTLLPIMGIHTPLTTNIFILAFSGLISILLIIAWMRNKQLQLVITRKYIFFEKFHDLAFVLIPFIFVIMSVLGAVRLNNDGDGLITLIMLIAIGIYMSALIYFHKRLDPNVIPTSLFAISLSMLFMTSLRGWYITGHDIQREYEVFEIAKNFSLWSVMNFNDAYNACLSITILPTIFYRMLKVFDPYIYKILFQIIFAMVPSIIYLTFRKYVDEVIALLSVIYFISFPTFFGDMPMLNRQEIAFLFLALMMYIIFKDSIAIKHRRLGFVTLSIGLILSHYSTTYVVIAMLVFLVCFRPILKVLISYFLYKKEKFASSGINILEIKSSKSNIITVPIIVALIAASFFWSSILTKTSSSSISRVIFETVSAIRNNALDDMKSNDTSYSIFYGKKIDPKIELQQYEETFVNKTRNEMPEGTFFDEAIYKKYPVQILPTELLPLTPLGDFLNSNVVNIVSLNYAVRQDSAKVLQLLIIIGMIYIFYKKRYLQKPLDIEFVLLAIGSLIVVLSQVILPVLSIEYGLLRAFQQALFFLGIFIVVGSLALTSFLGKKNQMIFVSLIAIFFFYSSTGVFTYILGGYAPQLHLSNSGLYYDMYYLHDTESASIKWLSDRTDAGNATYKQIQSDRLAITKAKSFFNVDFINDIYPGMIRKESYVYLGYRNTEKKQSSITYNSDIITYEYPIQFLDDNKDLIYSNGYSKIYK